MFFLQFSDQYCNQIIENLKLVFQKWDKFKHFKYSSDVNIIVSQTFFFFLEGILEGT